MGKTLAADGSAVPELSPDTLLTMYRWMLLGRTFEQRAIILQRQGRAGVFTPISGQEATYVGSALALDDHDWVAPTYRDFLPCCLRGLPLTSPWWFYRGDPRGGWIPEGVRLLPFQVVLGAHLPHAVGIAMGLRHQGDPGAVLAYFGDGASSEGDFHEALNFAGVQRAPVVFLCINNQWAISTPRRLQTAAESIAGRAAGYGIAGEQVDGMDAAAVYHATRRALARARGGGGPTLLEALTYRLGAHTTVDDPRVYRSPEEVEPWQAKDPLPRLQTLLRERGLLSEAQDRALAEELSAQVQAAFDQSWEAPAPDPRWMFDYVGAAPPPEIRRQREQMSRLQADKSRGGR